MSESADVVLAIDPGRAKCGVAIVRRSADPGGSSPEQTAEVLHRSVVPSPEIDRIIASLFARFSPEVILIGDGTTSSQVVGIAEGLHLAPVRLVDEKFSSVQARKRFFVENPPQGLRRLIPVSLQTPPRAYDDYVAVLLAERYLWAK